MNTVHFQINYYILRWDLSENSAPVNMGQLRRRAALTWVLFPCTRYRYFCQLISMFRYAAAEGFV